MDDAEAAFKLAAQMAGYGESVIRSYLRILPPEEATQLIRKNEAGVTKSIRINTITAATKDTVQRLEERG